MTTERKVRKEISLCSGTALAINSVIGAGVFSLAGLALEMAGPTGSWVSWLGATLAISPFVYVFYSLSRRYGASGSLQKYATDALGEWSRQSVSLVLMGTYVLLIPVVAIVGGAYLQSWLGLGSTAVPRLAFPILIVGTVVNLMGTKWLGRLNRTASTVLALLIAALFVAYLPTAYLGATVAARQAASMSFADLGSLGNVSVLIFLALLGWESLSFASGECKNARKTMPLIYIASYLIVGAVYLILASIVAGAALQGHAISGLSGLVPLVTALPLGKYLPLALVIVVLGNVSAWTYSGSRMLYAGSTSEVFCPALSKLNKQDVPHFSLGYLFLLSTFVLVLHTRFHVTVSTLIQLANQNFMVIYLLCLCTFWKVEKSPRRWLVGIPALASCGFFLSGLEWQILYTFALVAIGLVLSPLSHSRAVPAA